MGGTREGASPSWPERGDIYPDGWIGGSQELGRPIVYTGEFI